MKFVECQQGGAEWVEARLGKPTASRFGDFLRVDGSPLLGRDKKSASETRRKYAIELVGERLTRTQADHFATAAMQRGTDLEPRARAWYEFETGRTVKQMGFILHDSISCGYSPDGIGEDRIQEIKCPMTQAFLDYCDGGIPDDHMLQIQAGMWITKLPLCDYILWTDTPGLAPQIIAVPANKELHAAFDMYVPTFCASLDALEAKLRAQGHGKLPQPAEMPSWDDIISAPMNE